jgi:hypothetical protein
MNDLAPDTAVRPYAREVMLRGLISRYLALPISPALRSIYAHSASRSRPGLSSTQAPVGQFWSARPHCRRRRRASNALDRSFG